MAKRVLTGTRRRFPVANDIFYPDSRETLASQLASWDLKTAGNFSSRGGQVIIAPHGAWDISGSIAGAAFASVQGNDVQPDYVPVNGIRRVILLGPCHGCNEEGIYLSESDIFQTPLGNLPVDRKLNRELASCSTLIRVNDIPHLSEHSLEVLLPLVKYCFPDVRIIPILANGGRPALISGLARALRVTLENYMEESLLVISSNVSRNMEPALALSMAEEFRSVLLSMDTGVFLASLAGGRISACGAALIAALLESGLLDGKRCSALTPLINSIEEDGQTIYYGAFAAG